MSDWVDARLADLEAPAGWEPDVDRAFDAFRQRARRHAALRRKCIGAAAFAAAASLVLAAAGLAWEQLAGEVTLSGQSGWPDSGAGAGPVAAVFDDSDQLRFPSGYRNWVYVGTSLGLSYAEAAVGAGEDRRPEFFQNVFIDPQSYARYTATGEFPEGTVMILEVASAAVKNEPGLQGRYEGEILGVEASVKDSSRFDQGWAYFSFTDRTGETKELAEAFPAESCWTCHHDHAETDHVFTQFYPVL